MNWRKVGEDRCGLEREAREKGRTEGQKAGRIDGQRSSQVHPTTHHVEGRSNQT